jgi:predicted aspartyl protease
VISGSVSEDGVPEIEVSIAGQNWSAIVDTGFNGDLELPEGLRGKLNEQSVGRLRSALAGGQTIEEDAYLVDFPFDGRVVQAVATFASGSQLLIGTNLLREYRLEIRFVSRFLQLSLELYSSI